MSRGITDTKEAGLHGLFQFADFSLTEDKNYIFLFWNNFQKTNEIAHDKYYNTGEHFVNGS